jgi:hypothetical protein
MVLSIRNNSYSLFYQLLSEEKNVGLLRLVKREKPDIKDLVKKIGDTSRADAKLLEKLAAEDPTLNLHETRLPPGEVATRAAIASTKEKDLLSEKGDKLDLTLLITQFEALNYGWHLARVAGDYESQPNRARVLEAISDDLENLNRQLFALVLSKISSRP